MIRTRRTATTLLLVLLAAVYVPAVSFTAGATVQLPPVSNSDIYGLGIGGRVAIGFEPISEPWLKIEPEFALFHYRPNIAGFDVAWMLLPGLAVRAETPIRISDSVTTTLGASIGYHHYFWLSRYDGAAIRAFRPVLSAGTHALFALSESVSVGPALSYNVFFDQLVRGTIQLELRARYRITNSP